MRGRRRSRCTAVGIAAIAAGIPLLSGCPSTGSDYTAGSSGGHASSGRATAAAGVSSASASTTAGTTGSNGTTGGSTGTTGAVVFPACTQGTVQITGSVVQFSATPDQPSQPLTGPITVVNYLNTTQAANTDQQGNFSICVAPGTPLAPEIVADGYSQLILATIQPTEDTNMPPAAAIKTDLTSGLLAECNLPQIATDAIILVDIEPTTWDWRFASVAANASPDCIDRANWTFVLTDPNGTPLDAGIVYASSLECTGQQTDQAGLGVAELPAALSTVGVTATRTNNVLPDGGLICNAVGADPHFAFTGQAKLAPGGLTFIPFVIRAASFSPPGGPCWDASDCQGGADNRTCTAYDGGMGACCYTHNCGMTSDCCPYYTCVSTTDGGVCTPDY